MGQLLTLSWHVRGQLGAKMGKLTLLGGLRDAKLEPEGALVAAKKAPRGSKRATRHIGSRVAPLMLEPLGPPKVS